MPTFREEVQAAISYAAEVAKDHLGSDYNVTLIFHTDEGDPAESMVASTGDNATAMPPLAAAATNSEKLSQLDDDLGGQI